MSKPVFLSITVYLNNLLYAGFSFNGIGRLMLSELQEHNLAVDIYSEVPRCNVWLCPDEEMESFNRKGHIWPRLLHHPRTSSSFKIKSFDRRSKEDTSSKREISKFKVI